MTNSSLSSLCSRPLVCSVHVYMLFHIILHSPWWSCYWADLWYLICLCPVCEFCGQPGRRGAVCFGIEGCGEEVGRAEPPQNGSPCFLSRLALLWERIPALRFSGSTVDCAMVGCSLRKICLHKRRQSAPHP